VRATILMLALAGLTLAFLPTLLSAQTVGGTKDLKYRFDGAAAFDELGYSVSGAGDVDGDGFDDLIVGDPRADPGGLAQAGSAFVFSGADGSQLFRFDGSADGDLFGNSVSGAGDVDGDGFADLIVGSPFAAPSGLTQAGSAFVFSGADGSQLFRFDGSADGDLFGNSVSGAGDVDGDGFADLIVGARLADPSGLSGAGSAFVFSGADGSQLFRFDGSAGGDQLGRPVSGAGDVDGDGFADLIVGARFAAPGGLGNAGSAFVFSGADGSQLFRFDGSAGGDQLGISVSGAGDVDGDGFADLIVGAWLADQGGRGDAGSAFVFSGADGSQLFRFDGQASSDFLGFSVSGAGDVDSDGFDDLIVGAFGASPIGISDAGSAFVFSGADGSQLFRFDGSAVGDLFGSSVSGAGDVDGDGSADLIVGAPFASTIGISDAGSAFVFTFNPILVASGEVLSVTSGGTIDYAIDFPDVDAGAAYMILISAKGIGPTTRHGLAIPLTPGNIFRASFHGKTPSFASGFQGTLDSEGKATAQVTVPPLALPLKLFGRRTPLHLAVINSNFDFSSVARRLRFTL